MMTTFGEIVAGDQFLLDGRLMVKLNSDQATPVDAWEMDFDDEVQTIAESENE